MNENLILTTLANLLHNQIIVTHIEMEPREDNCCTYRFHCENAKPVEISVKGSRDELVALHKQTRVYWDTFKSIDMPGD
jgi:hypothetical protein